MEIYEREILTVDLTEQLQFDKTNEHGLLESVDELHNVNAAFDLSKKPLVIKHIKVQDGNSASMETFGPGSGTIRPWNTSTDLKRTMESFFG